MQYDTIILELLSRIKTLEKEVAEIRERISHMAQESGADMPAEGEPQTGASAGYQKMTDKMIMMCYKCGKKLHEGEALTDLVDGIADETGMNRNSAIMYLYAVSAMLDGTIYKRAISAKATRMYYKQIFDDFGSRGLKKALQATRLHIEYRKDCGHTVDSIEKLYEEYRNRY